MPINLDAGLTVVLASNAGQAFTENREKRLPPERLNYRYLYKVRNPGGTWHVMRTLGRVCAGHRIYSINEAFLSKAGLEGRMDGRVREARAAVLQLTAIPISVGIAPTKTFAKVANRLAKKTPECDGVLSLMTEAGQTAALAGLKLTNLLGLALRMEARLWEAGFTVILASDAGQAFAAIEKNAGRLKGLITDIRIRSAKSGWDVARHARENDPLIPLSISLATAAMNGLHKASPTACC